MIKRTPLPTTLEEAAEYAHKNSRIVCWAYYGEHIPLRCENHPELRWSTKNIGYIGARSIFYSLMPDDPKGPECPCPGSFLEPVVPDNWQERVVSLGIIACSCCKEELQEEGWSNSSHCHACFNAGCGYREPGCKAGKREKEVAANGQETAIALSKVRKIS